MVPSRRQCRGGPSSQPCPGRRVATQPTARPRQASHPGTDLTSGLTLLPRPPTTTPHGHRPASPRHHPHPSALHRSASVEPAGHPRRGPHRLQRQLRPGRPRHPGQNCTSDAWPGRPRRRFLDWGADHRNPTEPRRTRDQERHGQAQRRLPAARRRRLRRGPGGRADPLVMTSWTSVPPRPAAPCTTSPARPCADHRDKGAARVHHRVRMARPVMDLDQVVGEITEILDRVCDRPAASRRVGGVGLDSFASSLVGVDADGGACDPALHVRGLPARAAARAAAGGAGRARGAAEKRARGCTSYLAPRFRLAARDAALSSSRRPSGGWRRGVRGCGCSGPPPRAPRPLRGRGC
ncbi:hypothetical protein QJS66_16785 [Kocuria rhizophila]|nr:hypothetical protein QJS66_16785 [Kocuria rhizophila]